MTIRFFIGAFIPDRITDNISEYSLPRRYAAQRGPATGPREQLLFTEFRREGAQLWVGADTLEEIIGDIILRHGVGRHRANVGQELADLLKPSVNRRGPV